MVTRGEIHTLGQQVRNSIKEPYGYCYPSSKQLQKKLKSQTEATMAEIRIEEVEVGTEKHYVVAFPAKYVTDIDTNGRIIIDVTLDQYCTENVECGAVQTAIDSRDNIDPINIFPTKAEAPYDR